ncbi:MAG: HlyD family efflux transporter periplasmic adaptor subunit [Hyphomicrobiales bacterium]
MALKRIVLPAFIAAGVGILLIAWGMYFRAITVQVAAVQRDVAVQIFGLGTVEARITSKIGFKVSGVLVDLQADVGNQVPKGTALARLDDREQSARVARAKAAIEQTEANLQKTTAGLEKAKANLANAKSISERRQQLVQSSSASVESAETARTTLDVANAELSLASSDIAVSRAAIGDAKAQLQLEGATLDFHTLAAPYDAMITARLKELGSALGAGEPVFTLIDPKSVWVLTYIDESKSGEIKVGDPTEIVLRSRPNQRFQGKVARIEPESDRVNEERRVAIAFDQLPADFHLGEQAEAYITTVRLAQPLLVPETAIGGLGKNRGTVWTVEDGRLQEHEATFGHRLLDGRYEIIGGVPDKALVVSALRSGLRVGRAANATDEPRK